MNTQHLYIFALSALVLFAAGCKNKQELLVEARIVQLPATPNDYKTVYVELFTPEGETTPATVEAPFVIKKAFEKSLNYTYMGASAAKAFSKNLRTDWLQPVDDPKDADLIISGTYLLYTHHYKEEKAKTEYQKYVKPDDKKEPAVWALLRIEAKDKKGAVVLSKSYQQACAHEQASTSFERGGSYTDERLSEPVEQIASAFIRPLVPTYAQAPKLLPVDVKHKELRKRVARTDDLIKEGKIEEALKAFEASATEAGNKDAYYNMGMLYMFWGKFDKARESFKKSGKKDLYQARFAYMEQIEKAYAQRGYDLKYWEN